MITESFLHFLWQTLRFSVQQLQTTTGESVQILKQGKLNANAGPDFLEARIRIGEVEWAGAIEIHLAADDWFSHQHHHNPAYNQVILHIVWETGKQQAIRNDGSIIPELKIQDYISPELIEKWLRLEKSQTEIVCSSFLTAVPVFYRKSWLERLAIQRLIRKADPGREVTSQPDWDELLWKKVAGAIGGPVNREMFELLAEKVSFSVIRSISDQIISTEALILGVAGWLEKESLSEEALPWKREWEYLSNKYQLSAYPSFQFRQHRMRPASFPLVRMIQLASFARTFPRPSELISKPKLLRKPWQEGSAYWKTNRDFGKPGKAIPITLSQNAIEIILINAIYPVSVLYFHHSQQESNAEKMLEELQKMKPESNQITKRFQDIGWKPDSALESQAMIELYKNFCENKKCLQCEIGNQILKTEKKN